MLKQGPTALTTGMSVMVTLFGLLLAVNWLTVTTEITVWRDHAADILLTQRASHDWLLTGHYARYGVHHPGPFFLYVRLLGQWLVGGWTATVFGAQLVGVMACSSAFAGLFTALLHRLAMWEGACRWTAAGGAVAALVLVLVQFSTRGIDANIFGTYPGGSLANFWMPEVIILPFLTFMTAAVLLLQGSVFGLVTATFTAAALVHSYIPMPTIVGPVWLLAVVVGWRTRLAEIGSGFPWTAWVGVGTIIAVFALPMVLDAILDPPGNIAAILEVAARNRQTLPLLTPYEVLKLLGHQWHEVRYGLWLAVAAGLAVCVVTGRYRRLLRGSVVVTAFIIMTSALTFAETFGPPMEYSVRFFVATALLPIVFGAVVVIINLGLRHRRLALAAVGTLLLLFPTVGSLFRPYRDMKEIHAIARFIADENPLGSRVELDSNNKMVSTIFSLIFDLDRFGIASCYRNPDLAYALTQERICRRPPPSGVKAYKLYILPCPLDSIADSPEMGQYSLFYLKKHCVYLSRLGS